MTRRFTLHGSHASFPAAPVEPRHVGLPESGEFGQTASDDAAQLWSNPGQALHLPENYEPGYAYPLIVWLHGAGSAEGELAHVLPQISNQNYIGLSLQGNLPVMNGKAEFTWSLEPELLLQTEQEILESVLQLRRTLRIHPDRIYLAGRGVGGTMALAVALNHPRRFAGVISLGGRCPELGQALANFRQLRNLRVLMSSVQQQGDAEQADLRAGLEALTDAGVSTTHLRYAGPVEDHVDALRDIDRFIMAAILRPTSAGK